VSKFQVTGKIEQTARLENSRSARFAEKSGGVGGLPCRQRTPFVIAYVLSIKNPARPPSGPRRVFRGTIGRGPGHRESAFILNGDLDLQSFALVVGIDCRSVIRICELILWPETCVGP
jgi:hypothetical protein